MQQQDITWLAKTVEPLAPDKTLNEASEIFLADKFRHLLSMPIVQDGRPVGMLSRYHLMRVMMKLYGRELYGKRPVTEAMNTKPVIVDINQSLEAAAQHIIRNIEFPITEDFILVDGGCYIGAGVVLDVLNAMEQNMANRNRELDNAYKELKASQAQLIQAEKMASLGQMVAGVAHEMNTPLGYVRSNIEIVDNSLAQIGELLGAYEQLLDELGKDNIPAERLEQRLRQVAALCREMDDAVFEDLHGLVKDALYGVDQVSELVMNLKNFSRLDQDKVDNIDLNDSLDSSLQIARNTLKHKVEIIKEYSELPPISCSPSQINQVFLNMLTNAAQSIEDRGVIKLRTWQNDDQVCVAIQDDGKGIPEENQSKIFDPFFTTKAVGEGTGMGLSICYKIIKQHGGDIQVTSEIGKGTVFLISLPCRTATLKQAI